MPRRSTVIAGRYTLVRELGRGGMGAVWLATDSVLGREVAMKRLTGSDAAANARAEREARLAAGLSDPHVVAVFDLLEDGDELWLVMEYVDGPTLAGHVATHGPMTPDAAAAVFTGVVAALGAAHAAGIVHRDVKPSNILLAGDGSVKLTDFGVARGSDPDATLTQTGVVTGSPAYLAPEVAAGAPATPASDVWSLGASLFHALTGHPPYEVRDGNVLGTLYRIVHEDPPHTDRAGWLVPLLAGTMTHDVTARWDLPRVAAFLATAGQGERTAPIGPVAPAHDPHETAVLGAPVPAAAAPTQVRPSRRGPLALITAAVVVLAAVAVGLLLTRGGSDDTTANGQRGGAERSGQSSGSPSPSTSSSAPPGPTAAGITAFIEDYLATAASDPRAAYGMLTRSFQEESHGWAGYDSFWGDVTKIHSVDDIRPSLDPLGVSYVYTYTRRGEGTTKNEPVALRLVYQDGHYLIDGEPD